MPREIKTTLSVDGEAAFKRAINEANTSMKNLGTELTLAQANFKKDGDAMKLMETRSKALNAEIKQQDEIVKALQKAVEDSTKAYGENSAKTEKWQAELNRAQAKLVNLQNELTLNEAGLDRNGKAFDDGSAKAREYGEALDGIGKNLSLETLSSGVGSITGAIETAISKVIELGKKVTETMREAAGWADDLITEAMRNSLTVEDQQRMEYASQFVDTSVDTIMSARDKIIKKMVGGWTEGSGKDQVDMWDFLGINIRKDDGSYRDAMEVLFDFGEAMKGVTFADQNEVRATAWSMEVLGKSYKDLKPLFEAGGDNFFKLMSEAPIVSEENVQKLGQLNDKFDEFDSRLNTLKNTAMAELAPALSGIVDSLNKMLENFQGWLETEEGKQAMSELSEAITELFSGLTNVDFSGAINTAKDAINAIKEGLKWLADHRLGVVDALKAIGLAFAGLKISEGVLTFLKLKAGWNLATGKVGGSSTGTSTSGTGVLPNQMDQTDPGRPGGSYGNSVPVTVPTTDGGSIPTEGIDWGTPFKTTFGKILNNLTLVALAQEAGKAFDPLNSEDVKEQQAEIDALVEKGVEQDQAIAQIALGMSPEKYEEYQKWKTTGTSAGFDLPEEEPKDDTLQAIAQGVDGAQKEYAAEEEPESDDVLRALAREMNDAQRQAIENWWDAYRQDTMGDQADQPWEEVERAFSDNSELLNKFDDVFNDWQTSFEDMDFLKQEDLLAPSEDLSSAAESLIQATEELKVNTQAAKAATEKVLGVDLKTFNALPPHIQQAVAAGAAAGVSGIRVMLDGAAVGRMMAPYVSQQIAAAVGR